MANYSIDIVNPTNYWPHFCQCYQSLKSVLAAILDYVNMTLPHVHSDDPIGFPVQFNIYVGLTPALLYSIATHAIILSCIVGAYNHLPAAILNI